MELETRLAVVTGARIRVTDCKQWPDLNGREGVVTREYGERWFIDFDPDPEKPRGLAATLDTDEFEVTASGKTAVREAPCPVPTCGRTNDVGVRVCWNCGGSL